MLFDFFSCQTQMGVSGACSTPSGGGRRRPVALKVVSMDTNGRAGERSGSVMVENNTVKEISKAPSPVVEVETKSAAASWAQEAYVEDSAAATEEQIMTPWSVSVAR